MLCSHTEAVCFRGHATAIDLALESYPLEWTAGSRWPIFALLAHITLAVRRHRFALDFACHELMPLETATRAPLG